MDLHESIPFSIIYQISEYSLGLDSVDEINPSMFKKNKYGLFYNSLDNTIFYEVREFNKKLEFFHIHINLLMSMITGERIYNNLYYNIFQKINNELIPNDYNILKVNENIEKDYEEGENNWNIFLFKKIMIYRINLFKTWLKGGNLKCYHLPLFYKIQLFLTDLKIHFSRKFYGDNDYSKVTPEMINLRFFSTTCATYDELCSCENKNINYYNKLYNNEIIWVNGLILQNAKLDKDYCQYLMTNKNNEKTNIKMNIIGITYSVLKYEKEEDEKDDNNEEKENNDEENENSEENESHTENNVTESKYSDTNGEKDGKIKKEENLEGKNEKIKKIKIENVLENKKVKVYIYEKKNRCKYHKYYKENSIGFMEFYVNSDKIDQNYIFEHNIRIIIDEYGDYYDKDNSNKKE